MRKKKTVRLEFSSSPVRCGNSDPEKTDGRSLVDRTKGVSKSPVFP